MNDEQIENTLLSIEDELAEKGDYKMAKRICYVREQLNARHKLGEHHVLYIDRRAHEMNEHNERIKKYDEMEKKSNQRLNEFYNEYYNDYGDFYNYGEFLI